MKKCTYAPTVRYDYLSKIHLFTGFQSTCIKLKVFDIHEVYNHPHGDFSLVRFFD